MMISKRSTPSPSRMSQKVEDGSPGENNFLRSPKPQLFEEEMMAEVLDKQPMNIRRRPSQEECQNNVERPGAQLRLRRITSDTNVLEDKRIHAKRLRKYTHWVAARPDAFKTPTRTEQNKERICRPNYDTESIQFPKFSSAPLRAATDDNLASHNNFPDVLLSLLASNRTSESWSLLCPPAGCQ
jgi:hypothetical protein